MGLSKTPNEQDSESIPNPASRNRSKDTLFDGVGCLPQPKEPIQAQNDGTGVAKSGSRSLKAEGGVRPISDSMSSQL